jgi:protein-S-isoprenylcysteine O-methyltransferase Ste14
MTGSLDPSRLLRRLVSRSLVFLMLVALLLFGAAGTLDWPAAWVYLALSAAMALAGGLWLARHDPGLLAERLGPMMQRGQQLWDKLLLLVFTVLWCAWFVLMGFDAVRFGWSHMPLAFQALGLILFGIGIYVIWLTMLENSYAAPVVRIQKERGHKVVSTGPYAYVRHPMYAGAVLYIVGLALLLGSWWGVAGALALAAMLGLRILLEERVLRAELDGYGDYAARVRYRLLPGIW